MHDANMLPRSDDVIGPHDCVYVSMVMNGGVRALGSACCRRCGATGCPRHGGEPGALSAVVPVVGAPSLACAAEEIWQEVVAHEVVLEVEQELRERDDELAHNAHGLRDSGGRRTRSVAARADE